ncbi:MAG TPA: neutral zinc metallopeptidase [Thermoanaerobaculia bacterium]|nr:neutral zinc metallopeptidase [Thermoanaerobaculia bacterium]
MRWTPSGRSADLEDRRGMGGGTKLGLGGFLLLAILSFIFKTDLFTLVGGGGASQPTAVDNSAPVPTSPEEEKQIQFVSTVLDDTQRTWGKVFADSGQQYRNAKLAIFTDAVQTGCGTAGAAMGPFYCPVDERVYIDLTFYNELVQRFGAPGDFAQAYVIAHELGHHVQNLIGTSDQVRSAQQQNPGAANELSVRLELQADCYAGIWAHSMNPDLRGANEPALDPGDIEEGINAAAAVGDDRIQRQSGGDVNPETWTHGSAKDRARWFQTGYQSGNVDSCDTFRGL